MTKQEIQSPAISVVIPCRNERDHIEVCIRSILAQEPVPGGFEVIVADGMSNDGTRDILRRLEKEDGHLRVIDNPNRLVSTALNRSICEAKGKIIVRMDAHTTYAPDYVRQCVAVLGMTGADNVGGSWVARGRTFTECAVAAAFQSRFCAGARSHDPDYEGEIDSVFLGCWPRRVFDRIGMFDEELVRNQDDEFNLRLTRAGGKIWQSPRIRSWYRPRPSLFALCRQYMQYGYWKVRVIQKHRIPGSWRHLAPGFFLLALLSLLLAALWSSVAGWAFTILVGSYAICNVAASLLTASRHAWKLFAILPVVFACYHLSYGYGFIRGIVDFFIFRRKPPAQFTELTRGATKLV